MITATKTTPVATGELIKRLVGAAKSAAILSNRHAEFQGQAADLFLTLAFKSRAELVTICQKAGVLS